MNLSKLTLMDKLEKAQLKEPLKSKERKIVQNSFDRNSLVFKQELGKGGFGYVYDATYKNNSVIVKCSLTEEKNKFIKEEYEYLNLLQKSSFRGIPKVDHSFVDKGKQHFMMEKLGTDLNRLRRKTTEKKFSLETTLLIALQVLQRLKSIHRYGILHNDIKPENLMIGLNDPNTIYLIDFGIAKRYIKDGEHILNEFIGQTSGTFSYNSLAALRERSLSRRDDLESLAYTLIKLRTGKLPWSEITRDKEMCKKLKLKLLREQKMKSSEEICDGMCEEFVVFLNVVRSLKFEEEPDYDGYYRLFEQLLNEQGLNVDDHIIWN